MSLAKFRSFDILIFSILAIIFEFLNHFASTTFEGFKLVFMSYSIVISLISIYRWGIRGSLVAFIGGIAACLVNKATLNQYLAYGIGNLIGVIIGYLIFQLVIKKDNLAKYKILLFFYLLFDFLLVICLRCLIIYLLDNSTPLVNLLKEGLFGESMSLIISCIILLVASRKNGNIMVDMISYIRKVQDDKKLGGLKEIKESSKYNANKPYTEKDEVDESNILDGGFLSNKQLEELNSMMDIPLDENEDPYEILTSKKKEV